MRLYSFVNFYLSSIQQGIQTAHLVHQLFADQRGQAGELSLDLWAQDHKTIIVLNGGANTDIIEIDQRLRDLAQKLSFAMPVGCFREDDVSLGGIMTCTGAVIPAPIYGAITASDAAPRVAPFMGVDPTSYFYFFDDSPTFIEYRAETPEWELINLIKSCRLAS